MHLCILFWPILERHSVHFVLQLHCITTMLSLASTPQKLGVWNLTGFSRHLLAEGSYCKGYVQSVCWLPNVYPFSVFSLPNNYSIDCTLQPNITQLSLKHENTLTFSSKEYDSMSLFTDWFQCFGMMFIPLHYSHNPILVLNTRF